MTSARVSFRHGLALVVNYMELEKYTAYDLYFLKVTVAACPLFLNFDL